MENTKESSAMNTNTCCDIFTKDQRLTAEALALCQRVLPGWRHLSDEDFTVELPKGFSTITFTIRARCPADPAGIFYRRLEGKDNAILSPDDQETVLLTLEEQGIAARCYYHDEHCRLETLYDGRTLTATDLSNPDV